LICIKLGKDTKPSLKVWMFINRQSEVVYKWREFGIVASLPRSGRPPKMTPRVQRRILREVKKNPRVSAKDLQKSLAQSNISVHTSTICKTMAKNGVHGRTPRRKPLLSKKTLLLV